MLVTNIQVYSSIVILCIVESTDSNAPPDVKNT